MVTIINSIKTADSMVRNMGLVFDGVGYNRQGEFSQLFLLDIARNEKISRSVMGNYLGTLIGLNAEVQWLSRGAEANAKEWIEIVTDFRNNPTEETAARIINHNS